MSISALVARGYGSFGSITAGVTRGYAIGEAVVVEPPQPSLSGGGGGGVWVRVDSDEGNRPIIWGEGRAYLSETFVASGHAVTGRHGSGAVELGNAFAVTGYGFLGIHGFGSVSHDVEWRSTGTGDRGAYLHERVGSIEARMKQMERNALALHLLMSD